VNQSNFACPALSLNGDACHDERQQGCEGGGADCLWAT
jgi:hypothetical protein